MKIKKIIAALITLSAFSLTGCLGTSETPITRDENYWSTPNSVAEEPDSTSDAPVSTSETPISTFEAPVSEQHKDDTDVKTETSVDDDTLQPDEKSDVAGTLMTLDDSGTLNIVRSNIGTDKMGEMGTWTILVYMCGSDLESESNAASVDLSEMLNAQTGDNVKFIVQTGGASAWYDNIISADKLQRYIIQNGDMQLIEELPNTSMGAAITLSDYLKWGVANYPAEKMGVVFWNHGGGSLTGVCFDENYNYDSLSLLEIKSAFADAADSMTDKFEFIGLDACLMSSIETANVLADYSRYMIGSEETEPGGGWNYTSFGNWLGANASSANGSSLGQVICDSYYEYCLHNGIDADVTLSVVDLSRIDDVIINFNEYAKEIFDASENQDTFADIARSVSYIENYGGNNKVEGYTNMVDLAGLISSGLVYSEHAEKTLSAIDNAVVYQRCGPRHSNSCGLSTYYPLEFTGGSDDLRTFGDVSVSPYYLAFVDRKAYSKVNNGSTENYTNDTVFDYWLDTYSPDESADAEDYFSDYLDNYDDIESTGESPFVEYYDEPDFYEDEEVGVIFGFSLTNESLPYIESVQASIMTFESEDLIDYGITGEVDADFENGIFKDSFDGLWFSLPDGQELAAEVIYEEGTAGVYVSPILLNGEVKYLRFYYDFSTYDLVIDGAWDGIDENGMAGRDVYQIGIGDTITPIYTTDNDEYDYYGEEYTFTEEPELMFTELADGEYYYTFIINDVYGDYALTDPVVFTIEDGEIYYSKL